MFKKVNAREKLIGWYHSGPKLRASDLEINELFKRYTPNPLLVIIDVQPKESGVPTDAYFAVEEIKDVSRAHLHMPTGFKLTKPGWHNHLQDIRPHAIHHRGRRSRGDWCRASASRYSRCRHWHPLHPHYEPTAVPTRPSPATARDPNLPPESAGRPITRQPRCLGQPSRHLQPSTEPFNAQAYC